MKIIRNLCESTGRAWKGFISRVCPCIFWLLYSGKEEYKVFKTISSFLYGVILGCALYELILVDLDMTPTICAVMGAIICLMLGLGNAFSVQIRCISLLCIPSFCGRAGRGVLKAIVLAYVIAGPVENLVANGKEVVRTFACTASLTYNLTRTRTDLMFKPFQDAILNMKADTTEVKDTIRSVREVVLPISEEVEDEEEVSKLREENDYLDKVQGDSQRSQEIENRFKVTAGIGDPEKFEKTYKKKMATRCEDVLSHGTSKCRQMFNSAYDRCFDKVSVFAAWLLCWPMKLTFVCNLVEAMGGSNACDPDDAVEPGFGEGYAWLKNSGQEVEEEFRGANLQYELIDPPDLIDVRDAADTAKSVMKDFQDKKYVLDTILLIIKRLLAFVFIKIILSAQKYHDQYLRDIEFDNVYVTSYFRRIDARRHARGQKTLLPLKKVERKVFIDPYLPVPAKQERVSVTRHTVKLLLEMVTATTFVLLDRLFFESLDLVQRHAQIDYQQTGSHDLNLVVKGTGMIANLVRSVIGGFSIKKRVKVVRSNKDCLPKPTKLPNYYIRKIYGTYFAIWFMVLIEGYTQRLRRVICAYFYPKREKKRVLFLYNETLKKRKGLFKFMVKQIQLMVREHRLALDANVFLVMRVRYPGCCAWLHWFAAARRRCLLCSEPEPRKNAFEGCPNPDCHFYHCPECWHDLRDTCYACTTTAEVSSDLEDDDSVLYM